MVLRKLTVALLSIGVMLPGLTHALAVRDIKTTSALGEPFRAEVELSDIGDLTEEDIKVGLASQEDFERLGIERIYFLTELHFDVVIQGGRSVVKISSNKRVTEPFLDFVVRISWPNNTRLQEVTAFLDPPMSASHAAIPSAPVVVAAQPVIMPSVVQVDETTTTQLADNTSASEEVADTSYRVRKNDTLWNVARRVRPSTAISVPQMMNLLHKANPQAFIANNINMLRNGEVLRVPTLSEMQTVSNQMTAHADTQVVLPQASSKPLSRQQIDATSSPKASLAVQQAPRAQMKLVAPTGTQIATAGRMGKEVQAAHGQTSGNGAGTGLAKPVAKASAHVHKLSQELTALEMQVKANDHKIAMQNARLAELEAQLKARRLAAEQAAAKHKAVEKSALEKKALATMVCAVATQSFLSTEAKAADAPAAKEGGSSMLPIFGAGLLLVIIGVIFFLKSKSNKKQEPQRQAKPAATPQPQQPTAKTKAETKPVEKQETKAVPKPAATPKMAEPKKAMDPLEEAQQYLEMERFPQAVGLLTKALIQTPDRSDIHLKLLEIFAKQKDRQSFEEQLAKLELLGEIDANLEADKLKALLPPAPKVASKDDAIVFERVAPTPVEPVSADIQSLEDLEKDFAMSLSQPNMKALDIEIRPDPVFDEPAVQEIESSLDLDAGFSFAKEAAPEVVIDDSGLDFHFEETPAVVETEEPSKAAMFDSGLSLDSLDDFLAEHKLDEAPAVVEKVEEVKVEPSFSFDQALADFKEEATEEPELNLTEGFELEEFELGHDEASLELKHATETGLESLDVDFSVDETVAKSDFNLDDVKAPAIDTVDLREAAAAFDQDLSQQSSEALDDLDLDFDVSIASDDVLADLDKEFSFLATTDENTTRLDLARAYIEMGDRTGARDLLDEVVAEGNGDQKNEAQGMLMRIG